jgi:hypothetical protein
MARTSACEMTKLVINDAMREVLALMASERKWHAVSLEIAYPAVSNRSLASCLFQYRIDSDRRR